MSCTTRCLGRSKAINKAQRKGNGAMGRWGNGAMLGMRWNGANQWAFVCSFVRLSNFDKSRLRKAGTLTLRPLLAAHHRRRSENGKRGRANSHCCHSCQVHTVYTGLNQGKQRRSHSRTPNTQAERFIQNVGIRAHDNERADVTCPGPSVIAPGLHKLQTL